MVRQPLELSVRRVQLRFTVCTTQQELSMQINERPVACGYRVDVLSWALALGSVSNESANQRYARLMTLMTDGNVVCT